jgi:hypothetical protein
MINRLSQINYKESNTILQEVFITHLVLKKLFHKIHNNKLLCKNIRNEK